MAGELPKIELTPAVEPAAEASVEVVEQQIENGNNSVLIILIVIGVLILIALVAIATILLIKNRKKPIVSQEVPVKKEKPKQSAYVKKPEQVVHSGKTMHLWDDGRPTEKRNYMYLSDVSDEERVFRALIESSVVVGREEGDIIIADDGSLSRKHFRVIKRGSSYYLEDLDSSNGTRYDGNVISGEVPIIPGGIITAGRHSMKVEMVEEKL